MRLPIRRLAKLTFSAADRVRDDFPGPRILIYHQIGAGHGQQLDVRPGDFSAQLDWLEREGYQVVSLADGIEKRGQPEARRDVVLTFDDGYEDMYRNGFPLLKDRELPFTLYITSAPVETGIPLAPTRQATPLTWDNINEMAGTGLATVAAHTHNHPDLRNIDGQAIRLDLAECDRLIEKRTGVRPRHFAYPWGYWSGQADPVVRERYDSAVLGGGPPVIATSDPLLLNRIPVQLSDGVKFFATKMSRGQRTEEFVRRRISGYHGP